MRIKATYFDTDGCESDTRTIPVGAKREAVRTARKLAKSECKRLNKLCSYDRGESKYPPFQPFYFFPYEGRVYDSAVVFINDDNDAIIAVGYQAK